MIPKFANPHLLAGSTELISRAEIFPSDGYEAPEILGDDPLVLKLNELLKDSLEANVEHVAEYGRKKRRRINSDSEVNLELQDCVSFRLLSSSQAPIPISLEPRPPPPSITREPECEDNEADAKRRMDQAQQAAVDSTWVIQEFRKIDPPSFRTLGKVVHVNALIPVPTPAMMVAEHSKSPRNTRPPVPVSQLTHYPYVASATLLPTTAPSITKGPNCPLVEISLILPNSRTRKRKRGKCVEKVRTQPIFWRPDPALGGKSLGYALGYPGNWAGDLQYQRDTMKTAVVPE